ncbi:Hypothetical protein DPCES_1645 [Desulfitobacterium hafniense]|uniref:Uncharacterized protein n=1 Tax=Desulfitobacterium hafniense TaxID=49338 RepID=A0A098AZI8_DESHA|nr:Hypothetical protein DPCES_1645 [Desulfitobacterium hafniense]
MRNRKETMVNTQPTVADFPSEQAKPAYALYDLCGRPLSQSAINTIMKARAEGKITLVSVAEQDPNREQYICTETGLLFEVVTPPAYLLNPILDHKKEV